MNETARDLKIESTALQIRKIGNSVGVILPKELLARKINSQFVELCFLGMQFVGLAGVFSALNIPDEGPMDGALQPAIHASR